MWHSRCLPTCPLTWQALIACPLRYHILITGHLTWQLLITSHLRWQLLVHLLVLLVPGGGDEEEAIRREAGGDLFGPDSPGQGEPLLENSVPVLTILAGRDYQLRALHLDIKGLRPAQLIRD